jgi:hypothetical protein
MGAAATGTLISYTAAWPAPVDVMLLTHSRLPMPCNPAAGTGQNNFGLNWGNGKQTLLLASTHSTPPIRVLQ